MIQSIALVVTTIALGVLLAYGFYLGELFRRRLDLDERFNRTEDYLEDIETAIISLQVDLVNLAQEIKRRK